MFDMAKKRIEDALALYNQLKHYGGESTCHRILLFIKQKTKEKNAEHFRHRYLMQVENQLQEKGRSPFVIINGNIDISL
jgi:hypothetical protein